MQSVNNQAEIVSDMLKLTSHLLQNDFKTFDEAQKVILDFHDCLSFHEKKYYIDAEPLITDKEYDVLYKKLEAIESAFPDLIDETSPTQRVGRGLTKDLEQVPHLVPMLSLDNSYNEEDILEFEKRARGFLSGQTITYYVEPKFDGSSISLVYENDKLIRAATRGDGLVGEDITLNARAIKNIPLKATFSQFGINTIEIRGEVVIRKDFFKKFNQNRVENGLAALANPRNSAAGALRLQDPKEVQERGLESVMYHISYCTDVEGNDLLGKTLKSRSDNIKMLSALGFNVPLSEGKKVEKVNQILDFIHEWGIKRDDYKYELDGMVIKIDDISLEDLLGATTHHPRWAIAYKFSSRQARTQLLNVEYQVGRVGTITPVAKLSPVNVGGVTVSSLSLFNEEFIQDKELRINDYVLIERAGDVIPYLVGVIKEARTGNEELIQFPKQCPECGTALVKNLDEAAWKCPNIDCPAQVIERLVHFTSRDCMEITGLGEAIVKRFFKEGFIKNIIDIYHLPYNKIAELEGFGQKSIENLKINIEKSKNRQFSKLIFALGIRYVGETTAKLLAQRVEEIEELYNYQLSDLLELKDIGPKVAQSVFDYFNDTKNRDLISSLKLEGVNTSNKKKAIESKESGGSLNGITFLFTGTLTSMGRKEASDLVEKFGGIVAGSLSSKVNILVAGLEAGSKLAKAQKLGTIKIISEQEFNDMINQFPQ